MRRRAPREAMAVVMSDEHAYSNLSPRMKRFARASHWLPVLTMFVGAVIRDWAGFWPNTALLAVLMLCANTAGPGREARR